MEKKEFFDDQEFLFPTFFSSNSLPHNPDFWRTLKKKVFQNIVAKEENAGYQNFLLFPLTTPNFWGTLNFIFSSANASNFVIWWRVELRYRFVCWLQMLWLWFGLEFCSLVNLFPNKPWFLRVCSTSLLKTLWEKEKLLVTSNFSLPHSLFYPFRDLSALFIKFEIVVCKLQTLSIWKSLKCVVWERVKMAKKGCQLPTSTQKRITVCAHPAKPHAQSVASRTWEQEASGSIPGSANIISED